MQLSSAFYIDGRWVTPDKLREFRVINPPTERPLATLALSNASQLTRRSLPRAGLSSFGSGHC